MKKNLKTLTLILLSFVCSYSFSQSVSKEVVHSIEIPELTIADSILIKHTGYTLSYNMQTNCPNWVAWDLTENEAYSTTCKRTNDFRGDSNIPPLNRVEGYDYKQTGYDRGHMCPAGDMKWSQNAMSDCFYMSNVCPQEPILNQQWWEHLERACRRWASQEECIYICCGPIYNNNSERKYIGQEVKIRVPDAFFKVIISLRNGHEKGIGFYFTNSSNRQPIAECVKSIDEIEEITHLNFFASLPDELENQIEKCKDLSRWE